MTAPELPTLDQIQRIAKAIGENDYHSWDDLPPDAQGRCIDAAVRSVAALAESGYVLVHTALDEATVERLARAVTDDCAARNVDGACPACRRQAHERVTAILAALAETSAQAGERRTADDATGGGEHG